MVEIHHLLAFCVCVLSSTGLTEIVVRGRILQEWRDRRRGRLKDLVHCPQCSGFWCGLILSFTAYSTVFPVEITPYWALESIVLSVMVGFATSLTAMLADTWLITVAFK